MLRTNEDWLDLRSGDPRIQDEAVGALQDQLRRIVSSQFRRRDLTDGCIDDLVQETSLKIFAHLSTYRSESRFITWSTAIAVRTGLDMLRRGFWAKGETSDFYVESDKLGITDWYNNPDPPPEVQAQQQEVLRILEFAMGECLTKRQCSVLVRKLQGWTATNIAAELGTTRGSVYKLSHDARKRLKGELESSGTDAEMVNDVFSL
jgi:RNA polymerase sigma-70 factor, ECF subfamily